MSDVTMDIEKNHLLKNFYIRLSPHDANFFLLENVLVDVLLDKTRLASSILFELSFTYHKWLWTKEGAFIFIEKK
jgi:hypothetical protein